MGSAEGWGNGVRRRDYRQVGSTTLPRVPPTCQSPANGNKQPHGTMSLSSMRPLVPIGPGWASSVGTRQIVSWRGRLLWHAGEARFGGANVRSRKHHDLV